MPHIGLTISLICASRRPGTRMRGQVHSPSYSTVGGCCSGYFLNGLYGTHQLPMILSYSVPSGHTWQGDKILYTGAACHIHKPHKRVDVEHGTGSSTTCWYHYLRYIHHRIRLQRRWGSLSGPGQCHAVEAGGYPLRRGFSPHESLGHRCMWPVDRISSSSCPNAYPIRCLCTCLLASQRELRPKHRSSSVFLVLLALLRPYTFLKSSARLGPKAYTSSRSARSPDRIRRNSVSNQGPFGWS